MFFLGIDSGTQSTKVVVLDFESGNIVASAQRKHDLIGGLPSGHMEQHPADWVRAAGESIEVDGRLNDAVWQRAVAVTDFVQKEPIENAPPESLVAVGSPTV